MCCLWEEDGLPTSTLGEKLQQVGGTLTGVLERMEQRGVIRRERDARSSRIWRIWLTESGRELQLVLPPMAMELREASLLGIPNSDRQRLSELIDRALANLS